MDKGLLELNELENFGIFLKMFLEKSVNCRKNLDLQFKHSHSPDEIKI